MSKSVGIFCLLCFLLLEAGLAWGRRPAPTPYHWERINVTQVLPSQIFAKLGLTHSTRYGFTRDGHNKKTPDPTFPPGLTDVVPYDADHLLLVRGTTQGLTEFRARVQATESEIVATGRWHVTVDLMPEQAGGSPIGLSVQQDVVSDIPFLVTVGEAGNFHTYQLQLHSSRGVQTVTCQSSLALPAATAAHAVWTPTQVWTPVLMQTVPPTDTVIFSDLAADRQAARSRIGMSPEPNAQDYQVRLVVTAPSTPVVPVTLPAAPPPNLSPQEDNPAQP